MKVLTGRSFVSDEDAGGATFRIVLLDEPMPPAERRQEIATAAVEMATVFIAPDRRHAALHNRKLERVLIAHGLLGAVHACRSIGLDVDGFTVAAGEIPVWTDDDGRRWLRAPAGWSSDDRLRQVGSVAEVEEISSPPADEPVLVWAWIDETAALVRARFFGPALVSRRTRRVDPPAWSSDAGSDQG